METIEICTNELFKESETVEVWSKSCFKKLLSLTIKDSHYIFDGTLYKQIDDFWVWIFWVGLLSWVLYNFHLWGLIWSFFTWGIIDPFLNTREVIQYFGTYSRFYYLVAKKHLTFYSSRDQIVGLSLIPRCLTTGTIFRHLQV